MNQLTLFDLPVNQEYEFEKMKKEWEKTRRSLYARNAELTKTVQEMSQEFQMLKMYLCKGKLVV
jgi:uncharacterized membrane-anchored protein YhcB (DUF1043 family)